MSIKDFIAAVDSETKPPCEQFNCHARYRCAEGLLACTSFRYYVRSGRTVRPEFEFPSTVTEKQQPVLTDRPRPTRAVYNEIMDADRGSDDEKTVDIAAALEHRSDLELAWGGGLA